MGAAGGNASIRSRVRRGGGRTGILIAAVALVVAGVAGFVVYRSGRKRKEATRRERLEALREAREAGEAEVTARAAASEPEAPAGATGEAEVAAQAETPEVKTEPKVEAAAPVAEIPHARPEKARPAPAPAPAHTPVVAAVVHVSTEGDDANPGTKDRPLRTIARALSVVPQSGRIKIAAGVYREGGLQPARGGTPGKPFVIQGAGADKTFIKGSREVGSWQRSAHKAHGGDIWKVDGWKTNSQQLFCDGEHLQQIGARSPWHTKALWAGRVCLPPVEKGVEDVTPGSFYHDGSTNTLYCMLADRSDPNGHLMEASVRDFVLDGGGISYVTIRKLAVMHCNATAKGQHSTLFRVGGSHWTVEDCLIEYGDFAGLGLGGTDQIILRCTIRRSGDVGINMNNSDRAHGWHWYLNATRMNILIEDCVIEGNNYRNFYASWHAGGMKCIPACRAVTVRGCTVRDNNGAGIWFDHAQGDILIEDNLVVNNKTGIFYEISAPAEGDEYGALIRNNRVVGSVHQGIYVSASERAIVEKNTCYGNWVDIVVHGMPRGKFRLRDNVVRDNIICGGKHADLILFAGDGADNNVLDGNFYVTGDMARYGKRYRKGIRAGIAKGKGYDVTHRDVKRLARETGLERKGRSGDPLWVNPAKLDLRLLRGSPALGKGWQWKKTEHRR